MSGVASVSFSIVSHRQGHLIENLLTDLHRLWPTLGACEIILTLNLPEDESFIHRFCDLPLQIIRNPIAKGFGENHNSAFDRSTGDIFAVLNPDLRFSTLDLGPMREVLSAPEVGLWAPLVVASNGKIEDSARRFPTVARLARRTLLRKRTADYAPGAWPIRVDWVAGMFVALPRRAYAQVHGFDRRYFMYMEDADICRRLQEQGLDVMYDARVRVVHDARRASRRSLRHMSWHLVSALRFLFRS